MRLPRGGDRFAHGAVGEILAVLVELVILGIGVVGWGRRFDWALRLPGAALCSPAPAGLRRSRLRSAVLGSLPGFLRLALPLHLLPRVGGVLVVVDALLLVRVHLAPFLGVDAGRGAGRLADLLGRLGADVAVA